MANWNDMLREAFEFTGDDFSNMATTLSPEGLQKEFDDGYGGSEGEHFTAWGEVYVYFPVVYDGSEWVGYAPRNVCNTAMRHVGGE